MTVRRLHGSCRTTKPLETSTAREKPASSQAHHASSPRTGGKEKPMKPRILAAAILAALALVSPAAAEEPLVTGSTFAGEVSWIADGTRAPDQEWASIADQFNCGVTLTPGLLPDGRISL